MAASPNDRIDIYGPIHKGLRLGLVETLLALGRADAEGADLEQILSRLRDQLQLNSAHLRSEDAVIHPALLARAGVVHRALEAAHDLHRKSIARLEDAIDELIAAGPPSRERLLHALYLRFSIFVAEDLLHMANEEMIVLPALHALLSDAELAEMKSRIISALSEEEREQDFALMLRAANRSGRRSLLAAIAGGGPTPPKRGGIVAHELVRESLGG